MNTKTAQTNRGEITEYSQIQQAATNDAASTITLRNQKDK